MKDDMFSKVTNMIDNGLIPVGSPNVFVVLTDSSGSMQGYEKEMKKGIERFTQKMLSMDEKGSVIISRGDFAEHLRQQPYGTINEFQTGYCTGGGTRLYESVQDAGMSLISVVEFLEDNGYDPKAAMVVFSDGQDSWGQHLSEAQDVVNRLNELGIVTAFVCFGSMSPEIAEEMGFKNIDREYNVEAAFNAISSSCIRQSQSSVSLTDSFFDNN